jgi:hypothetical protein
MRIITNPRIRLETLIPGARRAYISLVKAGISLRECLMVSPDYDPS